ncbi:MAG: hypothetical protein H6Q60_215 [Oscillospiraceae bacterium]|nr:hypothetical protein [Oscillospiraceae bacterium]
MGKAQNWYLQGWEYEDRLGEKRTNPRRVLVYKGDYYSFRLSSAGLKRLKVCFLCLTLVLLTVYIAGFFLNARRFLFAPAGIPYSLAIIPLIYLVIGVCSLLTAKEPLTYRAYFGAVKRTRWAADFGAALLAVAVVGQIIYLFQYGAGWAADDWFLAGNILCTVLLTIMLLLFRRFPAKLLPQKNEKRI